MPSPMPKHSGEREGRDRDAERDASRCSSTPQRTIAISHATPTEMSAHSRAPRTTAPTMAKARATNGGPASGGTNRSASVSSATTATVGPGQRRAASSARADAAARATLNAAYGGGTRCQTEMRDRRGNLDEERDDDRDEERHTGAAGSGTGRRSVIPGLARHAVDRTPRQSGSRLISPREGPDVLRREYAGAGQRAAVGVDRVDDARHRRAECPLFGRAAASARSRRGRAGASRARRGRDRSRPRRPSARPRGRGDRRRTCSHAGATCRRRPRPPR